MKKITLFSILAAFVAALSFTACNSSSDNSWTPPTAQEKAQAYQALSMLNMTSPMGDFTYFCKKGDAKIVSDSTITAEWNIGRVDKDSALTITINDPNNGIAKALADYIPDYTNSVSNSGVKTALKNYKGVAKFICPIYWYQSNPITFLLYTKNLRYNLEYDGGSHTIDFVFYANGSSYGVYQPNSTSTKSNYKMSMQLNLYGFRIDKAENDKSEPTKLEVPASNGTANYAPFYFNVK